MRKFVKLTLGRQVEGKHLNSSLAGNRVAGYKKMWFCSRDGHRYLPPNKSGMTTGTLRCSPFGSEPSQAFGFLTL
jgi:hypothetical protein